MKRIKKYFAELLATLREIRDELQKANRLLHDIRATHDTFYRNKSGGYHTPGWSER